MHPLQASLATFPLLLSPPPPPAHCNRMRGAHERDAFRVQARWRSASKRCKTRRPFAPGGVAPLSRDAPSRKWPQPVNSRFVAIGDRTWECIQEPAQLMLPVRRSWPPMSRFPPVEQTTQQQIAPGNPCQCTPWPFRSEGGVDIDNILKIHGKRNQKLLQGRAVQVTAQKN